MFTLDFKPLLTSNNFNCYLLLFKLPKRSWQKRFVYMSSGVLWVATKKLGLIGFVFWRLLVESDLGRIQKYIRGEQNC